MDIEIKTEKWIKATEMALEMNDKTLSWCLNRVIYYARTPQRIKDEVERRYKFYTNMSNKAGNLLSKLRRKYQKDNKKYSSAFERATILSDKMEEKYKEYCSKHYQVIDDDLFKVKICNDIGMDFYFVIEEKYTHKRYMNGGINFHKDHWEIHT